MNNVTLMGRLTKDIDLRYFRGTNGETAAANYTLAVDKNLSKEKKEELEASGKTTADFIICKTYGKVAEVLAKYTKKGSRLLINGKIQTSSYERDGTRVYTTEVVTNEVEILDFAEKTELTETNQTEPEFEATEDKRIPF